MAIETLHTFTGNEVVATELPNLLNENFTKVENNRLKTVNNVAQDANNNINVTELIPKQITSDTNLNNVVTSGEYTFTKGSATITNSPTTNSFFLTVLRNDALVKQVVTEVVLDDPITYTRILNGSSWSPWVEGGKVKTINSIKPDDSGNVDLAPMDYAVRSELGIWKPNESVSVGDVRYLNGRENAGIVLECTQAGTTGTEQPVVNEDNIVANFTSNDRIGHMRLIFNLAEKDEDEVIALGVTYNRTTYKELWDWVQTRPSLVITEEEWQTKYTETNGKFVPYYSSGNGTTTFRTPLLSAYIKGAGSSDEVGNYLEAGLPNIEGGLGAVDVFLQNNINSGAFKNANYALQTEVGFTTTNRVGTFCQSPDFFSASRCSSVYGNSNTVTPESMVGIWVIKAIGIVIDNNNTDVNNFIESINQLESNKLSTSGGTMTGDINLNNVGFIGQQELDVGKEIIIKNKNFPNNGSIICLRDDFNQPFYLRGVRNGNGISISISFAEDGTWSHVDFFDTVNYRGAVIPLESFPKGDANLAQFRDLIGIYSNDVASDGWSYSIRHIRLTTGEYIVHGHLQIFENNTLRTVTPMYPFVGDYDVTVACETNVCDVLVSVADKTATSFNLFRKRASDLGYNFGMFVDFIAIGRWK